MKISRKAWLPWLAIPAVTACWAGWLFWEHRSGPHVDVSEHAVKSGSHSPAGSHEHAAPTIQSLTLSDQARGNLDLQVQKVVRTDYWRSLAVPAEIIEEPGHCEQRITTSLDGIVQKIHVLKGQTVYPGAALFDLKLVGGPLADGQSNLLKTVQNLELVNAELARIAPLADQGTIPIRTLLEKQYEKKRLESQQHTDTEELLIRGLTEDQVQGILRTKSLLREFTVRVPRPPEARPLSEPEHPPEDHAVIQAVTPAGLSDYASHDHGTVYTVEQIDVVQGELVRSGDPLSHLALHTVLLIEGRAFEREASLVERALKERWPVEAHFETGDRLPMVRKDLKVLSIENSLDSAGRTLKFFIPLVNEVFLDQKVGEISYRNWRFRPGQKVRLLLPTEFLPERMVLPTDSLAREGADAFVFRMNGRKLERVPVVIDYQDAVHAVLGPGSRIHPGDVVAINQAYQLNLMLRQAESPHAGHDHEH